MPGPFSSPEQHSQTCTQLSPLTCSRNSWTVMLLGRGNGTKQNERNGYSGDGIDICRKGEDRGKWSFKLLLFPSLCLFSAALQMQYVACREADMGWWVWTKGSVALGPRERGPRIGCSIHCMYWLGGGWLLGSSKADSGSGCLAWHIQYFTVVWRVNKWDTWRLVSQS